MPDPIIHDGRHCLFSVDIAERMIDKAVQAGYERTGLRFRINPGQRRCLRRYLRTVAPLETLIYESENSVGMDSGFFSGIPYVVDKMVREDVAILEVIKETERIGMIDNLGVDHA